MAVEFSGGDVGATAERFKYPAAIYMKDRTIVFRSPTEMAESLAQYKKRLSAFDHKSTKAQVLAITSRRKDKQIVWVKWCHYDTKGSEIEQSSIKYFCFETQNWGMLIQLGEYFSAPHVCPANGRKTFGLEKRALLH